MIFFYKISPLKFDKYQTLKKTHKIFCLAILMTSPQTNIPLKSYKTTSYFLNFTICSYTRSFFLFTVKCEEALNAIKSLINKKIPFNKSYSCQSTNKFILSDSQVTMSYYKYLYIKWCFLA